MNDTPINQEILFPKNSSEQIHNSADSYLNRNTLKQSGTIFSSITSAFSQLQKIDEITKTIQIIESLKNTKLNKDVIKAVLGSDIQTTWQKEAQEMLEFTNLSDFVNHESLDGVMDNTNESYDQLKVGEILYHNKIEKRNMTDENLSFLIESIKKPIDQVHQVNTKLDHFFTQIKQISKTKTHYLKKFKTYQEVDGHKARIRSLYSHYVLKDNLHPCESQKEMDHQFDKEVEKKSLDGIQEIFNTIVAYSEEMENWNEELEEKSKNYEQNFYLKKEAYKELVNLSPNVKQRLQSIEENINEFEDEYKKVEELLFEVNNLVSWYKHFNLAYEEMFPEIERRVKEEEKLESEIKIMRNYLAAAFEKEVNKRKEFEAKHKKFLPTVFHPLITEVPVKYEIYPFYRQFTVLYKYRKLSHSESTKTSLSLEVDPEDPESKLKKEFSQKKGSEDQTEIHNLLDHMQMELAEKDATEKKEVKLIESRVLELSTSEENKFLPSQNRISMTDNLNPDYFNEM